MRLLAHPFRLNELAPGSFVKLDQGSNGQKAQEVAGFLLTHREERPIYQEYGISDPAFDVFDETEIASGFASFYTTITLNSIEIQDSNSDEVQVIVDFR